MPSASPSRADWDEDGTHEFMGRLSIPLLGPLSEALEDRNQVYVHNKTVTAREHRLAESVGRRADISRLAGTDLKLTSEVSISW